MLFIFSFRFENSILEQLCILDHNAFDKRGKVICIATYFETKSFKAVSNPINMLLIYCWEKNSKKDCMSLKLIVQRLKGYLFNLSWLKDAFSCWIYPKWPLLRLSQELIFISLKGWIYFEKPCKIESKEFIQSRKYFRKS